MALPREVHIFISARFGPGHPYEKRARETCARLQRRGIKAVIVEVTAGQDFAAMTVHCMNIMKVMLVIGCDEYGAKTKNGYCSFHELQLAYQLGIPIIVVQMCVNWPPKPSTNDLDGEGAKQNSFILGRQGTLRLRWHNREWNADECAEEIAEAYKNLQTDASSTSQDIQDPTINVLPPTLEPQPEKKGIPDEEQNQPEKICKNLQTDASSSSQDIQDPTIHDSEPPQPEKKGKPDEEQNQPEGMKENKTDEEDQKADEKKDNIQKWGPSTRRTQCIVLLAIITITVSIVMFLTLKKPDRKYWGGEACKTNENCYSKRCDLDSNICFCKDEEDKDYCHDSTFICIDTFQCGPKPTAAPTPCESSIVLGNENKVLAEDASTDANFGWSISIDRSIAVVGAYRDESAYVLERSGSKWDEVAKLSSDTSPPDFGVSVAIDGDTIIVGARGSAFVFQNTNGSEWDFVTTLETTEGYDGDEFGMAVAVDGNTAIVGAVGNGIRDIGSAHIFVREDSEWAFQKRIFAFDGTVGDDFGKRVAVHGDTAIVGKQSSAFIFSRNGSDWDVGKKLIPKDAPIMSGAYTVAINEDTAVIGAIEAAYIFTLSGSEWAEEKMLSVEIADIAMVISVALDENTLILGNVGHNSISTYARDGFEWKEAAKITATSLSTDGDEFGHSVAVSENVVMIGAPGRPGRQGSIYIMDYVACV